MSPCGNDMNEACLHCERRPAASALGLCPVCKSRQPIQRLYTRRRGWTAVDEQILRQLRARANLRLPLFPNSRSEHEND
jgi:hypothetical protein